MLERFDPIVASGARVEALSRDEAKSVVTAYCEAFLEPVRSRTGRYRYLGLLWHAFTYGFVEARSGRQAEECLLVQPPEPVCVVPEDWPSEFVGVRIDAAVHWTDLCDVLLARPNDWIVLPDSRAWGMSFDHESMGPWFVEPPLPAPDGLWFDEE